MEKKTGLALAMIFLLSFSFCFSLTQNSLVTGQVTIQEEETGVVWESTGSKYADISGSQRIKVLVTQESTVKSGVKLVASCSDGKVGIYPLYQSIILEPGETATVYFVITNLGVAVEIRNIPITVSAYETYMGTKTSEATVYATLLPTLHTDEPTITGTVQQEVVNASDDSWLIFVLLFALIFVSVVLLFALYFVKRQPPKA